MIALRHGAFELENKTETRQTALLLCEMCDRKPLLKLEILFKRASLLLPLIFNYKQYFHIQTEISKREKIKAQSEKKLPETITSVQRESITFLGFLKTENDPIIN